jgi:predicted site-specific integrase-resolvase
VVAYCRVSSASQRRELANQRFEHYATTNGCQVLVLNQDHLSPELGMVQDLMTIVHCFSSRLDGLRNDRRQLRAALDKDGHAAGAPHQD